MALLLGKKKNAFTEIPVSAIKPNAAQPRRRFDEEGVEALAESIRRYGVLQPLCVRRTAEGFELIAGERRLRAATLAGLERVPCVLFSAGAEDSAVLAMVENLMRRDLDMFEEASAIATLIDRYRLTQEEVAARLSLSQSAVANKLRLLRLSEGVRHTLLENGLTERHARALLRLETEDGRAAALSVIVAKKMNVSQAEAYVEGLLSDKPHKRPVFKGAVKDVRIFRNSVERAMTVARHAGMVLRREESETEKEWIYTIRIRKAR